MKLYTFDSKTLKYKSFNVRGGLVKIVFLLFVIFLVLGVSPATIKTEYITAEKLLLIEIEEENKFSEKNLIEEISKLNFKYPYKSGKLEIPIKKLVARIKFERQH